MSNDTNQSFNEHNPETEVQGHLAPNKKTKHLSDVEQDAYRIQERRFKEQVEENQVQQAEVEEREQEVKESKKGK